jgi:hypothetical protein
VSKRLRLAILAQTIEDILCSNLDRPLTGAEMDEADEIYEDAIVMLSRYPNLFKKFSHSSPKQKEVWLNKLTRVLNE